MPLGTILGWAENRKVYPIDLGIWWDCLHIYGRFWNKKYPGSYNIKFLHIIIHFYIEKIESENHHISIHYYIYIADGLLRI